MAKERVRHIIETGLLESYLLGLTMPDETKEIEHLLSESVELRSAYRDLEDLQFQITNKTTLAPPADLKEEIRSSIFESNSASPKLKHINIYGIAASLLLLVAMAFALNKINENKLLNQELSKLELDLKKLQLENEQLAFLAGTGTEKILLKSKLDEGELEVMAYWNNEKGMSKIQVNQLPSLSNRRCFQMWADVDGEMISLGVIKNEQDLADLKFLRNAESLNITIEKEGGSDHPDVSNLVVSRKII